MKLSSATIDLLRNFGAINSYLPISPGNTLQTYHPSGIIAKATVSEEFPAAFAIYDLEDFLRVVGLFPEPDFEFRADMVHISGGEDAGKCTISRLFAICRMRRSEYPHSQTRLLSSRCLNRSGQESKKPQVL
jgi:hypothetical protein